MLLNPILSSLLLVLVVLILSVYTNGVDTASVVSSKDGMRRSNDDDGHPISPPWSPPPHMPPPPFAAAASSGSEFLSEHTQLLFATIKGMEAKKRESEILSQQKKEKGGGLRGGGEDNNEKEISETHAAATSKTGPHALTTTGSGSSLSLIEKLTGSASYEQLGYSVSISNEYFVVGAFGYSKFRQSSSSDLFILLNLFYLLF